MYMADDLALGETSHAPSSICAGVYYFRGRLSFQTPSIISDAVYHFRRERFEGAHAKSSVLSSPTEALDVREHEARRAQQRWRRARGTGVPRSSETAPPPRTTIGPYAQVYGRVLGESGFS